MSWFSAGLLIGPSDNTVLADTGPFSVEGSGKFTITLISTISTVLTFEHRNAANNENVNYQILGCLANQSYNLELTLSWEANERFRLLLNTATPGIFIQGSLFTS